MHSVNQKIHETLKFKTYNIHVQNSIISANGVSSVKNNDILFQLDYIFTYDHFIAITMPAVYSTIHTSPAWLNHICACAISDFECANIFSPTYKSNHMPQLLDTYFFFFFAKSYQIYSCPTSILGRDSQLEGILSNI